MPDETTADFGATLREARERAGTSLRQIASNTKISVQALEALERNDLKRLPGGIFSRAFVRAYAREVGLEPEACVERFVAAFPEASAGEAPPPYDANPDRISVDEEPVTGRRWVVLYWVAPLVLVVLYFGFGGRVSWWREPPATPSSPATAETSGDRAVSQPATQVPSSSEPDPILAALQPPASLPAGTETTATPPGEATRPESPTDTSGRQPGGTVPVLPEGVFRMGLTSRGTCWVSVRVNGTQVFATMMQAGERKEMDVSGDVSFTLGDPSLVDYTLNGQPGRPFGTPGQLSTIRLNAKNLGTFIQTR